MLVSADDRGVNDHVFVVLIACQQLENTLENPTLRPLIEALMDDLPITKPLREITPRNAGSISIENSLDE
jgi:hypothetical protein